MLYHGYSESAELRLISNAGLHQNLWSVDCTQGEDHLEPGLNSMDSAIVRNLNADDSPFGKDQSRDERMSEHRQVGAIHVRIRVSAKNRKPSIIRDPQICNCTPTCGLHHATVGTVEDGHTR